MQLQQVSRDDAEKIFLAVKNVSGSQIDGNAAVNYALTGNSVDGLSVVDPVAASFLGWIGVADQDIADTGFGRAQCWGYRDSVLLSHEGTSVTVTIGDALHLVSGQAGLSTSTVQALSTMASKFIVAASTITVSAADYVRGIIRCL